MPYPFLHLALAVVMLFATLLPMSERTGSPVPPPPVIALPLISAGGVAFEANVALTVEQLGVRQPVGTANTFLSDTRINSTGDLAIWLPPNARPVRGILFRNGSGVRMNPADPAWRSEVAQNREQAVRQIASLWGFAYLSGAVWTEENRSSYEQQEALLHSALDEFATAANRPELRHAPLLISGGSRFSAFSAEYAARYPARVIAYDVINGGNGTFAPGVPGIMFLGAEDSSSYHVGASFARDRAQGALLAVALIWGTGHNCDRCVDLAYVFFDQMVRLRLPADADPRTGPVALKPLDEADGWLGDVSNWTTIAPYDQYAGDKRKAAWFPNRTLALLWQGFMLKQPLATLTWPTQPYKWSDGFTQEPAPFFGRKIRDLSSARPVDVTATSGQPTNGSFEFVANDRLLGAATLAPDGKTLTLTGASLPPGLYGFVVTQQGRAVAWPAGLVLLK
jgi:hypothetical protein